MTIYRPSFCTVMSILCHWACSTRTSSAETTCYFPDGRVASTYQPCNSTVGSDASVCCEVSTSVCGSQGLCYGLDGYLYRGGCTDRKWKSAGCPTLCLDVAVDAFALLVPCASGVKSSDFCCSFDGRKDSCCSQKFQLNQDAVRADAGNAFALSTGAQSTSLKADSPSSAFFPSTSAASATSSSFMTPASSASITTSVPSTPQSPSHLAAVGAAVGVPLGILLFLNLGFLLLKERRHRISTQQSIQEAITAARVEARGSQRHYVELPPREPGDGREELDSREMHEIHDTSQQLDSREVHEIHDTSQQNS